MEMVDVEIVWIDGNEHFGSLHMQLKHGIEKHEVEEVLLELLPEVEAKQAPDDPKRTYFWGQYSGRAVVICFLRRPARRRHSILNADHGIRAR